MACSFSSREHFETNAIIMNSRGLNVQTAKKVGNMSEFNVNIITFTDI